MRKKFKSLLGLVLAVSVALTMSSATMAFSYADDETATTTEEAVTSSLAMFKADSATVTVNDDATVTVEYTSVAATRTYAKVALMERDATDAELDAAAITCNVTTNAEGKHISSFEFNIPVEKINEPVAYTTYETSADGTTTGWKKDYKTQHYFTVNNTSDLCDQLIAKIYVQTRNDYTDTMCTAAKKCWDALTDEQKAAVEEYDYFGVDTGDASKDDPLNQDNIGDKELLVVSFGTSFNNSRTEDIGGVEKALQAAYPGYSVRRAFTAQIIINHIQAREGVKIDNVEQAMERAVANGVKTLVVQPTHLMSGAEYDELKGQIDPYADKMTIEYGAPLLNSDADRTNVAKEVAAAAAKAAGYTSITAADSKTAFVFLGHGTSHENQLRYTQMQEKFTALGYTNCFMGTVEGKPEATSVDSIVAKVKAAGYTKVVLRPLMVVAGDHANNDMAGDDEDSWKSIFTNAGFSVSCQINGLGELPAIQQIYVNHTNTAMDPVKTKDEVIAERDAANEKAEKAEAENAELNNTITTIKTEVANLKAELALVQSKVTGVKAKAYKSSHKIVVSWKKNANASGYIVYRATKASGTYKKVATTTKLTTTIKNHKAKKTYYYKVRGYKKIGSTTKYSNYSAVVKVKAK